MDFITGRTLTPKKYLDNKKTYREKKLKELYDLAKAGPVIRHCPGCDADKDIYIPSLHYCKPCFYRKSAEGKKRWQLKNKVWYKQYKEAHACSDCKKFYPSYVMQFDHLPDKDIKRNDVSQLHGWSRQRMLIEIGKCEIVCANCHAIRTHKRRR